MRLGRAAPHLLANENVAGPSVGSLRDAGYDIDRRGALRRLPTQPMHPGDVMDWLLRRPDLDLLGRIRLVTQTQIRQRPFPSR